MAGAGLVPSPPATCEADENPAKPAAWTQVSEHLSVYHGPINVGLLHDGHSGKALLIDCGDGRVSEEFEKRGVTAVDRVIFTHHHRDQACGGLALKQRGAKIGVPAAERDQFDKVAAYWANPASRWHLYNFHPHHLMLGEPLGVDDVYEDGQTLAWGPARIRVIVTPGHTDGSISSS